MGENILKKAQQLHKLYNQDSNDRKENKTGDTIIWMEDADMFSSVTKVIQGPAEVVSLPAYPELKDSKKDKKVLLSSKSGLKNPSLAQKKDIVKGLLLNDADLAKSTKHGADCLKSTISSFKSKNP